jgi:hypothetical protein
MLVCIFAEAGSSGPSKGGSSCIDTRACHTGKVAQAREVQRTWMSQTRPRENGMLHGKRAALAWRTNRPRIALQRRHGTSY